MAAPLNAASSGKGRLASAWRDQPMVAIRHGETVISMPLSVITSSYVGMPTCLALTDTGYVAQDLRVWEYSGLSLLSISMV